MPRVAWLFLLLFACNKPAQAPADVPFDPNANDGRFTLDGGVIPDTGLNADTGADAEASDVGPGDASPAQDTGFGQDLGVPNNGTPDAGTPDAGTPDNGFLDSGVQDLGFVDQGVPDAGSLDPNLSLPDPAGAPCTTPGSMNCPGIEVCRFYTPAEGRCESCAPCGNLNASCSASNECDILFMCYVGRCTNFCTLGSFECGPVEDCLDIGHPTRGVCAPF